MLATARRQLPPDGTLPGQWVAEQKPDGFRAILFARPGLVMVQSRQGADLTLAFPEIAAAATGLVEALVLDGELVVPHAGRLHFGELQNRARRRGRSAVQAAADRPAYHRSGTTIRSVRGKADTGGSVPYPSDIALVFGHQPTQRDGESTPEGAYPYGPSRFGVAPRVGSGLRPASARIGHAPMAKPPESMIPRALRSTAGEVSLRWSRRRWSCPCAGDGPR
ncbi:hypothetical protein [Streptomyces sp. NPDC057412]|uniref:ATP-dependent DNA ligase n=1 Tax=Streptomyces sp. NPDC057412 TaxID=3346123 RepID=UPI00368159F0